ncbi:uncharacterized protein A1O5_07251 [Cladophialophora psammophila CBS 110553]|uniref:Uncharacterized protein n=1 Tax=Cladophialophora psammophila CBS 110553 TaxID=1182543 RepID=W9WVX2_9EURO|nr:uncharacterized protein A1O5_07251 [Cladophialophora psammophila CBS 110553]EXJ69215.1 hypothetical protein A1O5_07251 [Cladophialophora psammophila CBS 110553]
MDKEEAAAVLGVSGTNAGVAIPQHQAREQKMEEEEEEEEEEEGENSRMVSNNNSNRASHSVALLPTPKIAIRMTTIIHVAFGWNVGDHITNDLRIRKHHPEKRIADFAAQLGQRVDSPIDIVETGGSWHSPDLAFAHVDAHGPGIVFEIAFSSQKIPLHELAQEYIGGSKGEVQTVVAFDIGYPAAKQAKVLVWKKREAWAGQLQAELVLEEEFQKADGSVNAECKGLYLSLSDFCPERMIPADVKPLIDTRTYLGRETGISISPSRLCHFLAIAKWQREMINAAMREQ